MRTFELARRQLQLGSIGVVSLLNAEQALSQAQLAAVQARANRLSDTAALFRASKRRLVESTGGASL